MNLLVIIFIVSALFFLAYRFYARWVAVKVFEQNNGNKTPAVEKENGVDYVPSNPLVVFSHHFASIAGAGPIVGPTLALSFGTMPVLFWIVIGSIFVGGIHDFTVLFASIREGGRSIADVIRRTLGKGAYMLVISFTLVVLFLVMAVFLKLTVASLTSLAPLDTLGLDAGQTLLKTVTENGVVKARIGGIASTSLIVITLFAPLFGFLLYKRKANVLAMAAASIAVCALSVAVGVKFPVSVSPDAWYFIVAGYTLLAAGIPVWIILQPRDFINSFFLYIGIALLFIGSVVAGITGAALQMPAVNMAMGTQKLGDIWPFLFITVACGACSGFHALVAGGTSSKQISRESDAIKVGYGSMLLEGLLAASVVLAVGFALNSNLYQSLVFPSEAGRLSNPNLAFALSLGILSAKAFHLPVYFGTVLGILLLEGFLVTTLDTTVRLTRYLFEELWSNIIKNPPRLLKSYLFNAALAVGIMLLFSRSSTIVEIWKVFGSANQLLAAISLLAVTLYLRGRGKPWIFTLIPAVFMSITTIWSLVILLTRTYIPSGNITLILSDGILILLSLGVIVLSVRELIKGGNRTVMA